MQRPAGVVLLSTFFASLAGVIAALLGVDVWRFGVWNLIAGPEQIIGLLGLLLGILLLAFLSYGLWDLDEDARWVAFAFFTWPALFGAIVFAHSFSEWNAGAGIALLAIGLFGAPSVYLQLRPVRRCFVQLIVLDLSPVTNQG